MPFFTKHSVPAVPRADLSPSPDSLKKQRKVNRFTLKQFRVKNDQNCPNNNSKFSIFRFTRSECKTGGSAEVEAQHVEHDARPTYVLSTSVSKIHEDRNSSFDISPHTNLCETSQEEECCPCLLEDSYHPDKVHKKHWYTINRKESCKNSCSKNDDQKCRQPANPFKRSFTPISRPFLRFLHHNSDNGIHYFFESRDCECYNSTESFKTLFGCNDTICQACDTENDCPSIFSAAVVPMSGKMCTSDDCFSTEATLLKLDRTADFCISLGSVIDCKTRGCSPTIPVLSCEGQDCSSPASFVVAREANQCSATNYTMANNDQHCSISVDLILSCGAQECSSISSAPTGYKEPYSSAVDLVLGCELEECGPICRALDTTSQESGSKSTLFLLESRLGLCSTKVSALSCKELDCDPESSRFANTSDTCCSTGTNSHARDSQGCNLFLLNTNGCASSNTLLPCRTPSSSSAVSVTNEELSCRENETHGENDEQESGEEFEREKMFGSDEECYLPDTGFSTRSDKSPCTGSSKNLDSSKVHRFTLKQFRVKTKQKCTNNRTKVSICRLSGSKFMNDHSAVVEAHVVEQKTMPTDTLSKSVPSIHKDRQTSSDPSPETSLSEISRTEKCCSCLLEDSYHPDKLGKKHWYTITRKQSCKNGLSKKADQKCRRPRKHLKESFSQITNVLSRFLHQNSEDGIHYFFESRDSEYYSTQTFDSIFGCNETVCQTCDSGNNCQSIFSIAPLSIPVKTKIPENCFSIDTTSLLANKPAFCCDPLGSAFDCEAQECPTAIPAFACAGQDCSSPACVILVQEAQQSFSKNWVIARDEQYCSASVDPIMSCGAQECSSVSSSSTCETELCTSSVDLALGCELKECIPICKALCSTSRESDSKSTLVLFGNGPMLRSSDDSTLTCNGLDYAQDSFVLVNKRDPCCYSDTNSLVEDRQGGALDLPNTNGCASTRTFSLCSSEQSCAEASFSSEELLCLKDEIDQQSDEHESEEFEHYSLSSPEQECGSPVSGFLTSSGKCSHPIRNLSHRMSKECF